MSQLFRLQLLFLLSVLLSRSSALPPLAFSRSQTLQTDGDGDWKQNPSVQNLEDLKLIFGLTRASRHADGLFTSGYSRLLGQLSAKDYLESLIAKRVNGDLDGQLPVKRHSDAVFTDNYSRYRKQMAVKKYLNSMLQGKRSCEAVMTSAGAEDPSVPEVSVRTDPSPPQPAGEDAALQEVIDQLTLVAANFLWGCRIQSIICWNVAGIMDCKQKDTVLIEPVQVFSVFRQSASSPY
ncbi:VIP peptides-like [Centroberyx affinis]|uniref:VIP peptides-like n=1 Tax=Centroberyx affinis TaxID=166261 RepID=UPI003A5C6AF4